MASFNEIKSLEDDDPCMNSNCGARSIEEFAAGVAVTPHLSDELIALAHSFFAEGPLLMNK